jgi:hypothetical protein
MLNRCLVLRSEFLECARIVRSRAVVDSLNPELVTLPAVEYSIYDRLPIVHHPSFLAAKLRCWLSGDSRSPAALVGPARFPLQTDILGNGCLHLSDEKGSGTEGHFSGEFVAGIGKTSISAG